MKSLPLLDDRPATSEDAGFGALSTARGCLPLKAVDVQARIDGLVAHLAMKQTFVNVHDESLEATYIFPLPDRAAVTRFRLEVAGRVVEGVLKERGEARRDYDRAIQAGQRAAITEEERPGVFTIRVGNLPPGEAATVHLALVGPLTYSAGEATFRFPLVVAPRYIPGVPLPGPSVGAGTAADTDAVPDASRISPPVLLPGFPNPVELSLAVEVAPSSLLPRDFRSSLHTILYGEENGCICLRLQPGERLDRDFILRFHVGANRVATALAVQPDRDGAEGTFLLTLVPPTGEAACRPRDVAFILDRSGSMAGWKMVAARRALARMVDTLTEVDRFTVLAFDNSIETPPGLEANKLAPATDRQRFRAVEFLARIEARGGTEMAQPLDWALAALTDGLPPRRQRGSDDRQRILVLVTDGQVGNEDQLLRQLGERVKNVRIFTLGVEQAVNAGFLRRLADMGGGHSEVVESEDRLDAVMEQVHRHIGAPVLTDLHIEPSGLTFVPDSLVPARLPDLFTGTPLMLYGRYRGPGNGALALQARDGSGQMWATTVEVSRTDGAALGSLWARGRLRELEDRYVTAAQGRDKLQKQILAVSLRFGVLCRFTAFVAVDRTEVVNPGGEVHSVVQLVEAPAGWEMTGDLLLAGVARGGMMRQSGGAPRAMPSAPPSAREEAKRSALSDTLGNKDEASELEATLGDRSDSTTDYDAEESLDRSRSARKERRLPGFLGKLRQKLSRSQGASGPVDRLAYRQRALDLLQALQATPADNSAACLSILSSWLKKLKSLHNDLTAAGDSHASVQQLGEALQQAHTLLAATPPPDAEVLALCQRLVTVLREWLALTGGDAAPQREEFWK
jgi:Ca-activated chloride channel family protein